jgi:hypothetical protein
MNVRFIAYAAGMVVCYSATSGQETITLTVKADKQVVAPGESLKIEVWARLDPGVGSATTWNPLQGGPPEPGVVTQLGLTQFDLFIDNQTVKWTNWTLGPDAQFFGNGAPNFGPGGIFKNTVGMKISATDNFLYSATMLIQPGNLGPMYFSPETNPIFTQLVGLSVASQPTIVLDAWTFVGVPMQIQVIPAPSVSTLSLVAGVLVASRRRR